MISFPDAHHPETSNHGGSEDEERGDVSSSTEDHPNLINRVPGDNSGDCGNNAAGIQGTSGSTDPVEEATGRQEEQTSDVQGGKTPNLLEGNTKNDARDRLESEYLDRITMMSGRISYLNKDYRSMLFVMSLCVYNDWQNLYLETCGKLLRYRRKKSLRVNDRLLKLYKLLANIQRTYFSTFASVLNVEHSDRTNVSTNTETSVSFHLIVILALIQPLRTLWRRYRVELYFKALLIIFLLKLPNICYLFTTIIYVLYCLGVVDVVISITNYVRTHPTTQRILPLWNSVRDYIEPLLLIPPNLNDDEANQFTQFRTNRNILGNYIPEERSIANSQEPDPAVNTGSTLENTPGINPPENSPNPSANIPASEEGNSTGTLELKGGEEGVTSGQENTASLTDDTSSCSHGTSDSNSPQEGSKEVCPVADEEEITREDEPRVTTPTYMERVLYQTVLSLLLSLLPWWEPNPLYLQA